MILPGVIKLIKLRDRWEWLVDCWEWLVDFHTGDSFHHLQHHNFELCLILILLLYLFILDKLFLKFQNSYLEKLNVIVYTLPKASLTQRMGTFRVLVGEKYEFVWIELPHHFS